MALKGIGCGGSKRNCNKKFTNLQKIFDLYMCLLAIRLSFNKSVLIYKVNKIKNLKLTL